MDQTSLNTSTNVRPLSLTVVCIALTAIGLRNCEMHKAMNVSDTNIATTGEWALVYSDDNSFLTIVGSVVFVSHFFPQSFSGTQKHSLKKS